MSTNSQVCGRVCSVLSCLAILALITATVVSPAFSQSSAVRITQAIDNSVTVRLPGNTRPEATKANDRGALPDGYALNHILMVLQRSPQQEKAAAAFVDSLNNRQSPNFHKWLTAEEYGERFGVSQQDIDTVTGWLESQGFTINTVYASRMMIDFSGNAGQIGQAFHTSMHNLESNGETHIANMSDPSIPAALAPVVKGLFSLNDFKPHKMLKARPDYTFAGCAASTDVPTEPGTCYAITPADNWTIYNVNPLLNAGISGQGQTIALVEDTDSYGTDFQSYRNAFGLNTLYPSGNLVTAHPGGCADPGTNADDSEADLDVEIASAIAPSATIELISCETGTITFGGLIALENLVNGAGPYPNVVSVSYGVCEAFNGNGGNAAFYNTYQTAAAEGISVFGASGDEGPSSCSNAFSVGSEYDVASLGVSGWTDTPYNVAVGGTDFEDVYNSKTDSNGGAPLGTYWSATNSTYYGSALSYIPEQPWDDACANELISEVANGTFTTYGSSGTCNKSPFNTDTSYLVAGAGSGGASNCATGTGGTDAGDYGISDPECQGYAKPSWQSAYGVPNDQLRDIPDLSMFAANGVWGHYEVVCWSDPAYTSDGSASCAGAPSTWSGFGGTSVASPTAAAIQALVNQSTGQNWGNPNPIYYQIGQNEYGTQGGAFLGSGCNSSTGSGSGCVFNDVTQGDIVLACEDNGTTEEAHCYKPSGTYGVDSTDTITAATVIWGGSGYTSAPTCTIAGPTNSNPYLSPTGGTLYAGGSQATCTAAVSTSTTTAVWTVAFEYSGADEAGIEFVISSPTGASPTTYTMPSCSTTTVCASDLVTGFSGNSWATCTSSRQTVTCTAKTAGAAGNFVIATAPGGAVYNAELVFITNTTKGQGPNYVSGITIPSGQGGSGYQPETPVTLTGGGGSGALAVANTSIGTASSSYQPAYGAAPGFDMATGLGTINAYNMVNSCVWTSNCTTTAVSSSVNPSGYGEAVSFTATVTGNSPTGTVQFNVDGSAFGSPVTLSSGSATSGSTTTLTVGTHTVTAVYSGDSANHGSTGTLSGGQVVTTAGAEVTVQSSGSPSAYGQVVVFTATINGQYGEIQHNTKKGTPLTVTGTVTWSSNTGCGPTNVTSTGPGSATATCQTAMLPVGSSDQVTANYSGDSNHTPGSGFIDQAVTVAATAISVTNVNPSSVDYGSTAPVAISASLSWSGSGAAPTAADVTISGSAGLNGSFGATSCSAPSGDTMACNGTYTPSGTEAMGTYTMSAAFSGDGNYSASSSTGTNNFTINTATSSTTVTSSGSPSSYGSSVTFTATIDGENGSIKKGRTVHKGVKSDNVTGTVTWSSNTGCSASTVSGYPGVATCTTSSLAVGTDTVTASYGGDSNHQPSSGSFNQVVSGGAGTSINVTSVSPAAEDYGSTTPVAITAVLSWTGSGAAPTASDVSISGSGLSGSFGATSCGAPSSDTITCTNTYSPSGSDAAGSYTISAAFSGDSNYGPSNSPQAGNFTINLATTTTGVVGNPNPSTYAQSVTFTATINAENGNVAKRPARKGVKSQDVSGTVTWSSNTGCSPSTVSGYPGVATCTTSSSTRLPVGTDTVTATYSGDSNHSGSTGSENQVVQGGIATTISVTGVSPSSESYGQDAAVTITAQLTWTGNGKEPTKSDVTISGNGNGTYGATTCGTRSGDTITCTATYTPTAADNVGSYTETAAFSGDSIYSASSSSQVNNFSITQATQTITAAPPPGVKTKDSFTVSATGGGSGNPLTYSSGGDCTNSGATYTAGTRAGSCLGTINQAGNTNYSAATPYTFTVAVATTLAPSGATLTGAPSSAIGGSTFVVTATYPNTPGVPEEVPTITAAGACTVGSASGSGNTYQATVTVIKGSGTCTTTAKWAANFYYAAATADEKTTAEETTPNTTFTGAPTSAIGGSSFVVTATSDEGGTYASVPTITAAGACSAGTASSNGPGSYQATITMTKGSGTCTTKAEWAKSIAYAAATDEQTTTAEITTPTFGFTGAPGSAAEGTTFTVTATSNETGTYAVAPKITAAGSCTAGAVVNQGSGTYTSLITVTKASGTCTTTAKWAASIEYAADTLTQNTAATAATE